MIRVLHYRDPEEARRRIAFLGVSPTDSARLCGRLSPYLLYVPEAQGARVLAAWLSGREIAWAGGARGILFPVGSRAQVEGWMREAPEAAAALEAVREAIDRYDAVDFVVPFGKKTLRLGGTPRIMGVLNVTPDSFSDGGRFLSTEAAIRRGVHMAEEGADILDVGGESTRPGSQPVAAAEEAARVIPVIRELAQRTEALLSVDTTKAAVAREAVAVGASLINDTSALADDPGMAAVVRDSGCAVVLMHRRGTPATMQLAPSYGSLFDELLDELNERVEFAQRAGIPRERILVDPGVGFGKRFEDNLALHRHLPDLRNLGRPVLFGPSRKAFIGKITGREAADRMLGTAAAVALAAAGGASVIRVHDVREMKEVVGVVAAVREGAEC